MSDRYAVIGQPIAHSRSPFIHARFAQQTGQALSYAAIEIASAQLAQRLVELHAVPYLGLNATLPHKQAVMTLCESLSERAQLAGAVNTLRRTPTGWQGDNTDGEGCVNDLARLGITLRGRRVLILGAGGATRGIVGPLLEARPAGVTIANRSEPAAQAVAELFAAREGMQAPVQASSYQSLAGQAFDVILHATSAGHCGVLPAWPAGLFAPGAQAYDLSYGKAFIPFRDWALAQGAVQVEDGLGMLVEQAAAAFQIWRGVRPQTAPVIEALREQARAATTPSSVPAAPARA